MDVRFDRFATLYVASPLTRFASQNKRPIPILMYHSVAEEDESGTGAYYRISTPPEVFAAQMEYLSLSGYETSSLSRVVELLKSEIEQSPKVVAITFDDGYHNFYENAFPILNRFGFTATVYLPTAYVGNQQVRFKSRDCLTWSQIRELQRNGIDFGSHTVTHPQLHGLSSSEIEKELSDSKLEIENQTGCAVDSFAYPYAFPQADKAFKRTLHQVLADTGYKTGVCTKLGRANRLSDPLFLERLPVNGCDDIPLFSAKMRGAYDWFAAPQAIIKETKYRMGRT